MYALRTYFKKVSKRVKLETVEYFVHFTNFSMQAYKQRNDLISLCVYMKADRQTDFRPATKHGFPHMTYHIRRRMSYERLNVT